MEKTAQIWNAIGHAFTGIDLLPSSCSVGDHAIRDNISRLHRPRGVLSGIIQARLANLARDVPPGITILER